MCVPFSPATTQTIGRGAAYAPHATSVNLNATQRFSLERAN
jgi:hypothetical protein